MSLPQIQLDDRRFQELVTEARHAHRPELPGVDRAQRLGPGITLIELFAWMTDMLIYRVNRIPDKLHVALLELLGVGAPWADRRADAGALPTGGAARAADRDPRRQHRGRNAAHRLRRVDRLPGREDFTIPPLRPTRVRGRARR